MKKYFLSFLVIISLLIVGGIAPITKAHAEPTVPEPYSDLFFSEYIGGSSNNKALEIYNPTDNHLNLDDYKVLIYFNGNPIVGRTINLSGFLLSEGVFVLAHMDAHADIQAKTNQTITGNWYNGNDAIVLLNGTTVIDRIGQIGHNPGDQGWGSLGSSTTNQTLVRKSTITHGDNLPLTPFDPSIEWLFHPEDTFEYLGNHDIATHEVTFDLGEHGTTLESEYLLQTIGHNLAATAPTIIPNDGYTFAGWDTTFDDITSDLTVYAQWNINQYTITFVDEDGITEIETQTLDYGVMPIAPVDPTQAETEEFTYIFTGWTPEIVPVTGDTTYKAVYDATANDDTTVIEYTITFDSAGGSDVEPITQEDGTKINKPADPTREGYTFNGWIPEVPTTMPAEDMEVVAKWTAKTYTVEFLNWDGTPVSTQTIPHGTPAKPPANPTREGYTFTGWDESYDEITGNLVLNAQFIKNLPVTGENSIYTIVGIMFLLAALGIVLPLKHKKPKNITNK